MDDSVVKKQKKFQFSIRNDNFVTWLAFLTAVLYFIFTQTKFLSSKYGIRLTTYFNLINFPNATKLISSLGLVLIAVIITIFIFTATLLGNAARLAKEKQEDEEQKNNIVFDNDLKKLKTQINNNPKDIDSLKKQVEDIETKKKFVENKIKQIGEKYASLNVKNSVIKPGAYIVASLVFNNWLLFLSDNQVYRLINFLIGSLLLSVSIGKIICTLKVVEEVSVNADSHKSEDLVDSLFKALKLVQSESEPKPILKFPQTPPFIYKANTQGKIEFMVDLLEPGNKEAKNLEIWFLISSGIEIIPNSAYDKPFKQSANYPIPFANTTIYHLPSVKKNVIASYAIHIQPTSVGKYKLRYKINCDGHVESTSQEKEVDIIVQE